MGWSGGGLSSGGVFRSSPGGGLAPAAADSLSPPISSPNLCEVRGVRLRTVLTRIAALHPGRIIGRGHLRCSRWRTDDDYTYL